MCVYMHMLSLLKSLFLLCKWPILITGYLLQYTTHYSGCLFPGKTNVNSFWKLSTVYCLTGSFIYIYIYKAYLIFLLFVWKRVFCNSCNPKGLWEKKKILPQFIAHGLHVSTHFPLLCYMYVSHSVVSSLCDPMDWGPPDFSIHGIF